MGNSDSTPVIASRSNSGVAMHYHQSGDNTPILRQKSTTYKPTKTDRDDSWIPKPASNVGKKNGDLSRSFDNDKYVTCKGEFDWTMSAKSGEFGAKSTNIPEYYYGVNDDLCLLPKYKGGPKMPDNCQTADRNIRLSIGRPSSDDVARILRDDIKPDDQSLRASKRISKSKSLESCFNEDVSDSGSAYLTATSVQAQIECQVKPTKIVFTRDELQKRIDAFNQISTYGHGLVMQLSKFNDAFEGFIRVHLNLLNPIHIRTPKQPQTILEVIKRGNHGDQSQEAESNENTETFTFTPEGTTTIIHIHSYTKTAEVIEKLLLKFRIIDSPKKFAMYERTCLDGQPNLLRRLGDDELLLILSLMWSEDGIKGLDAKQFVLKENNTRAVEWESFSIPELQNFAQFLDREENDLRNQILTRYKLYRTHVEIQIHRCAVRQTTV